MNNKGIVTSVLGILTGILSMIFSFVMFGMSAGVSESSLTYGGDAYTGIQNAAAQTANNLIRVAKILRTGIGFMLLIFGLFLILYFASKIKIEKKIFNIPNIAPFATAQTAPAAPATPVVPAAPAAPTTYTAPVAPVAPAVPVAPTAPVTPATPVAPAVSVTPGAHAAPEATENTPEL